MDVIPPQVRSEATTSFVVILGPLEALISGGGMEATTQTLVTLDASSSYDPDNELLFKMQYTWSCSRRSGSSPLPARTLILYGAAFKQRGI